MSNEDASHKTKGKSDGPHKEGYKVVDREEYVRVDFAVSVRDLGA